MSGLTALTVGRLIGGVALLLGNGFFVTTEFALTRVRQFPESEFQDPGLERAWKMTEQLEIYLSGCQLGITVCSVGLGIVAEPAVAALFGGALGALGVGAGGHTAASVLLAYGFINILHVVVGEQMPTYLGIEEAKFVSRYGAPPLYWWTRVMYPVIAVADWLAKALLGLFGVEISRSWTEAEAGEGEPTSRAELRRQMGETLARLDIPEERRQEVLAALDIGETTVADIMVDADKIVALSTADDLATNLRRLQSAPHSRYPLVGDELTDLRGIVYTPALLRNLEELQDGDLDLEAVAAPPMTVGPDTTVADLIDRFQAENQELALVLDGGEAVGMVTATDAFEAITGDLQDPLDLELEHVD